MRVLRLCLRQAFRLTRFIRRVLPRHRRGAYEQRSPLAVPPFEAENSTPPHFDDELSTPATHTGASSETARTQKILPRSSVCSSSEAFPELPLKEGAELVVSQLGDVCSSPAVSTGVPLEAVAKPPHVQLGVFSSPVTPTKARLEAEAQPAHSRIRGLFSDVSLEAPTVSVHTQVGGQIRSPRLGDVVRMGRASWQVMRKIGEGTTAKVLLASDVFSQKLVAFKIVQIPVLCAASRRAAAEREVRILRGANHPNVIEVLGTMQHVDAITMVMPFAAYGSLQRLIRTAAAQSRRLPPAQVALYTAHMLHGLQRVHAMGFAHLDVKPANVLLLATDTAALADFGCAQAIGALHNYEVGTPAFRAPQLTHGDEHVDGKLADAWSVGVCAFYALTGALPFADYDDEDYGNMASDKDLPSDARDFVRKALVVDVGKRWSVERLASHAWIVDGARAARANLLPHEWVLPTRVVDMDADASCSSDEEWRISIAQSEPQRW